MDQTHDDRGRVQPELRQNRRHLDRVADVLLPRRTGLARVRFGSELVGVADHVDVQPIRVGFQGPS
jgi:hypothetical protein